MVLLARAISSPSLRPEAVISRVHQEGWTGKTGVNRALLEEVSTCAAEKNIKDAKETISLSTTINLRKAQCHVDRAGSRGPEGTQRKKPGGHGQQPEFVYGSAVRGCDDKSAWRQRKKRDS